MKKVLMKLCIFTIGSVFVLKAGVVQRFIVKYRQFEIEKFVRNEFKKGTSVDELTDKLREKADNTPEGKALAAIDDQRKVVDKALNDLDWSNWDHREKLRSEHNQLMEDREPLRQLFCEIPEQKMFVQFWDSPIGKSYLLRSKKAQVALYVREYGLDHSQDAILQEIKALEAERNDQLRRKFLEK